MNDGGAPPPGAADKANTYGNGAPHGNDGPPGKGAPRWPYAVLGLAVLVLGGGVWTAYDRGMLLKDPGVEACEAMRGGSTTFRPDPAQAKTMTEDEYRRARQVFADSRHDDIRDHGTKVMDIAWRMSQLEDDKATLLYVQPLTTQVLGLESACADQGVFLPVKAAEPAPAEQAAAPERCAQVFRNGQPIAKAFNGTCGGATGQVQVVPALGCVDGRTLYRVAASTGARGGWGFAGARFQAVGEATNDPAYAAAVRRCLG
ncbi:hypothetical protein Aab01nite_73980 [Paractinoplanes abujensis]|uniref:Uncharacterized protein n=1 Tax=Paractinoplanes abujensis TaxID=882441 RepID=A0A7W7CY21_9ACTN|nr:hypothetical protein [Actinoplanes abujensis]MBB4695076.1 hypothetical protein [Actinoplanes abujensis]GID23808.1 hypothetical protein Aab01nite_73980 [Actinoplanes abujensis]